VIDLATIRDGHPFDVRLGPARVALVHHGFRITQMGATEQRQSRFSARYPALGLLNLARSAQVDFEAGRIPFEPEFRYFDEDYYDSDDALVEAIIEWLRPACARFVMAGLYSVAFDRTATMLARIDPTEFCVVVGGAHPTVAPSIDFAHLVVRGEGGQAVTHFLSRFLQPGFGAGDSARGLCFQIDGEVTMGRTVFDRSLAKIPAPAFAYELCATQTGPIAERWWRAVGTRPQIYICTQSCRARCTFCSTYIIHGKLVSRPVELIAGDLDYMIDRLGHDAIHFHDDDLLQHEEFDALMGLLRAREVQWSCNARSEFMNANLAALLYRSGCRKVFLGAESFDQRSLDYYRKATTVEMNQNAIVALDAAGIGVVAGYIIGAPHDTVDSILADLKRALNLPIYFLAAAILTPDIGTVEFRRAVKRSPSIRALADGANGHSARPRPDLFGSQAPYGMPTVSDTVSKAELNELYKLVNCAFFLRVETLDRIRRYTASSRLHEAIEWCALHRELARELSATAKLRQVREHAEALLSIDKSSSGLLT
jgi:anaerobic magnesium-protoporphyrin IX monomethyl ester cyclase